MESSCKIILSNNSRTFYSGRTITGRVVAESTVELRIRSKYLENSLWKKNEISTNIFALNLSCS